MYAKIKANTALVWPYGYDELCKDNPGVKFTGVIDLVPLFEQSPEFTANNCQLVEVINVKQPFYDNIDANSRPFSTTVIGATTTPFLYKNGLWITISESDRVAPHFKL
jgi:hypothetical protein